MPGSMGQTYKLKKPIVVGVEKVDTLTFPESAMVEHLLKAEELGKGSDVARQAAMIGALAGIPMSAVEQIDLKDWFPLVAICDSFFGSGPAIGGGGSE